MAGWQGCLTPDSQADTTTFSPPCRVLSWPVTNLSHMSRPSWVFTRCCHPCQPFPAYFFLSVRAGQWVAEEAKVRGCSSVYNPIGTILQRSLTSVRTVLRSRKGPSGKGNPVKLK